MPSHNAYGYISPNYNYQVCARVCWQNTVAAMQVRGTITEFIAVRCSGEFFVFSTVSAVSFGVKIV